MTGLVEALFFVPLHTSFFPTLVQINFAPSRIVVAPFLLHEEPSKACACAKLLPSKITTTNSPIEQFEGFRSTREG